MKELVSWLDPAFGILQVNISVREWKILTREELKRWFIG